MHLRMTGTLLLDASGEVPYTRVELVFDSERRLRFVDPRRFGTGQLVVGADALVSFYDARLGVEPFDPAFTPEHLRARARGRVGPIKSFLLDQRQIAGVGNIYADEALPRAGPPAATCGQPDRGAVRGPAGRDPRDARAPGSMPTARRSTTSATSTARGGASRTASSCIAARASRARAAGRRSARSSSADAAHTSASTASPGRAGGAGAARVSPRSALRGDPSGRPPRAP